MEPSYGGLQMAAQHALPGTSFRIDCLSVVQVYNAGRKAATSASRYYARIWNVIFSCFDDAAEVDIAWMPAHTKADDVTLKLTGLTRLRPLRAECLRRFVGGSIVPLLVHANSPSGLARRPLLHLSFFCQAVGMVGTRRPDLVGRQHLAQVLRRHPSCSDLSLPTATT